MIFNPKRGGGGEKEYTIKASNANVDVSVTKQKPGHVFRATSYISRHPKMTFIDPDTGKGVSISGAGTSTDFVMPAADVTITTY